MMQTREFSCQEVTTMMQVLTEPAKRTEKDLLQWANDQIAQKCTTPSHLELPA